jgi:CHAT domain
MSYAEIRVRIERAEEGGYRVSAAGPTGEASVSFQPPFSDLELENFILRIGRTRRGVRRLESPEMQKARDFGGRLFDALFHSRVRDVYRDCFASVRAEGKGLRVKLSLSGTPELMALPWEYLYDEPAFLSISQFTPVVRYLELPRARPPLPVQLPLRILATVSAPSDAVTLDVDAEKKKLEQALRGRELVQRGQVEIRWLETATLKALQRELRREPYHIFHYIGHGGYDANAAESVLLFEDNEGRGRRVSGDYLGTLLADHTSLRLAVLNACEGARTAADDPFSGVASSLVRRELPAVIAMQFEITDRAAIIFADELYHALVEGLPVDSALAEARKAIYLDGNDIEWGTPVLFMRVPDGRVFDVPSSAAVRNSGAVEVSTQLVAAREPELPPMSEAPPAPVSAPVDLAVPSEPEAQIEVPEPALKPKTWREPGAEAATELEPEPLAEAAGEREPGRQPQAEAEAAAKEAIEEEVRERASVAAVAAEPAEPGRQPLRKWRGAARDKLVSVLALVGAAVVLFGTAIASARGFTRIEYLAQPSSSTPFLGVGWTALEAVAVPVAVLLAIVALGSARGEGLREVGILLGLGAQMTLTATGWLLWLVRKGGSADGFRFWSWWLAVPAVVGSLLVIAAAVLAWRRRPTTDEPVLEPGLERRRAAAFAATVGAMLTVAGVFVWSWVDDYGDGDPKGILQYETWLVFGVLGSSACALAAAALVVTSGRRTALAAGVLVALGLQTVLFFLPYLGDPLVRNPSSEPPGPGAALGLVGALLVTGSGIVLWRACEARSPRLTDGLRWPARLVGVGAAGVAVGFLISSSGSWTALLRPDGSGVAAFRNTTWHYLEAVAIPVFVATALVVLVRMREHRAFAAGMLLGFGAQTVAAALAALVYADDRGYSPWALLVVAAAAFLLIGAAIAVAHQVQRDGGEVPVLPSHPWMGMLALTGAACVAVALLLPDLRDESGKGRSFKAVNDWLILEPAVAAGLLAAAAIVLLLLPARGRLAAGVLVAVGAQTFLWFIVPIGVAVSEPLGMVSIGLGSGLGVLGALVAVTSGVLSYQGAGAEAGPDVGRAQEVGASRPAPA